VDVCVDPTRVGSYVCSEVATGDSAPLTADAATILVFFVDQAP